MNFIIQTHARISWGVCFFLMLFLAHSAQLQAQTNTDTTIHAQTKAEKRYAKHRNEYGKFNYRYLRIALPTPGGTFNNPFNGVPEANGSFTMTDRLKNSFTAGLEWGSARHFMGLHLGTEMLKLAINSGWTIQGFGQSNDVEPAYTVKTDGTYILRLGLGPQISFKPHEDFRIGIYYRAGLALVLSNYDNIQTSSGSSTELKTTLFNAAYNGDLGVDLSWHKISLGFCYSMMKIQPSKNKLFSSGSNTDNSFQQGGVTTVIDPKIDFNRFVISAGFAF